MRTTVQQLSLSKKILLLFISCLLFREGLYPILTITHTTKVNFFFIGFILFMVIYVTSLKRWLKGLIFIAIIYLLLNTIFFENGFVSIFSVLVEEWGRMGGLSNFNPSDQKVCGSILLFIMLLGIAYVWKQLFLKKGLLYLPFIFVCLLLIVISQISEMDVESSIVRVVIYFILCLSWMRWENMRAHVTNIQQAPTTWKWGTSILLIVVIAISSFASSTFSNTEQPSWVQITESIEGTGEGISLSFFGSKRIGYSNDDQNLGGPLKMDETILFRAASDQRYYWRGESKSIYTGRGWTSVENLEGSQALNRLLNKDDLSPSQNFYNLFRQIPTQENRVKVVWEEWKYPTLFAPGQLKKVTLSEYEEKHPFMLIFSRDGFHISQIRLNKGIKPVKLEMVTQIPIWGEDEFRKFEYLEKDDVDYTNSIREIELPENVPERIQELAFQITEGHHSNYDRAKAIEKYLKSEGHFKYETENVPKLPKGRDFVDHFIFDSKRGYCDHFSSSMVVMLRSIGVPARWVKGFAPGEATFDSEAGKYVTTVRNKDAHSWVEVYLEGIGWIPFEPTPNFTNPLLRTVNEGTTTDVVDPNSNLENKTPDQMQQKQERLEKELEQDEPTSSVQQVDSESSWKWIEILIGVGLLLIIIWIAWKLRMYVQWLLLFRFSEKGDPQTFSTAYQSLLRWMERLRGKRKDHQTLREYWVGDQMNLPEAIILTKQYEKVRYGKYDKKENIWQTTWKLWKNLIKQLRP